MLSSSQKGLWMISRRRLVAGLAATAAGAAAGRLQAAPSIMQRADLRGSIDASHHGVVPDGSEVSGRNLARLLAEAAAKDLPVYLPPGDYPVSEITLPEGCRITGVPGASRLVYTGLGGFVLRGDGARRIELSNLVIDGGAQPRRADDVSALVELRGASDLVIDNCDITRAPATGLSLAQCGGRIERTRVTQAGAYGLYALDSTGLSVTGNTISDCGDGGILIHRSAKGRDGTIVSGNRVSRIGAVSGGTGQWGNGINLFRAHDVMLSGNHVSDAAFSAIRANSASNVLISGNHCTGSGETAIYAEFTFDGAMIAGNLLDGAANGISVVNFNEGGRLATVSGNIVRNLKPVGPYVLEGAIFGIGISVEADTAITGNVVENEPYSGLALGFGPYLRNVVATGNIIRQAAVGCSVSVAEGAGSALIANNIFQEIAHGAIVGYRWNERATEDLAVAGAEAFSHLMIKDNRVS
jgi:uncharacterized secreted repeat protein (TIGR03808 family)